MDFASAYGQNSIALGWGSYAWANNSIAIGYGAQVDSYAISSVAIGSDAHASKPSQIVLGTASTTVYIPGKLIVGSDIAANKVFVNKDLAVWERQATWARDDSGDKFRPFKVKDSGDDKRSESTMKSQTHAKLWSDYGYKFSDRRLKNVGEVFKGGLAEIKKLQVFNYTYKNDKEKTPHVGVIAQDLQKIFPKAVFKGDDGFLRIRMEDMFYALVNAVKELDAKIELLAQKQKKVDELKKRVDALEKRVAKLEKARK